MRRTAFGAVFAVLTVSPALAADDAAPGELATPAVETGPLAIAVFDQPNFKGRTLTFTKAVPDLGAVKFDDKVASLTISGAGDWVLCENRNYGGRCSRVQGKAENLGLLQLAGRVSSLYPVPATPAPATPAPATAEPAAATPTAQ